MKNLIKIFIFCAAIFSGAAFAQSTPCTQTICGSGYFQNSDNEKIYKAILWGAANASVTSTPGAATSLTISSSINTGSATIAAGAQRIEFLTSAAFTGSINGISHEPNYYIPFGGVSNRTTPAITYTVTTGSLTIIQTR